MAAAVFHHAMPAAQALAERAAQPLDNSAAGSNGTSQTSGAGSGSATITANDFLTLLVTEMQNQDPTANMDPNEYIDQLVQVNSLEQLIDINQTLNTDFGWVTTSSGSETTPQIASGAPVGSNAQAGGAKTAASTVASETSRLPLDQLKAGASRLAATSDSAAHTQGNLNVPRAGAAAQRVAHALDGRTSSRALGGH